MAIDAFILGMVTSRYHNKYLLADLGYAHFLNGNMENALKYYQLVLHYTPDYSVVHYYLGLWYLKQNDLNGAYQAFYNAHYLYPKNKIYEEQLKKIIKQKEGLPHD